MTSTPPPRVCYRHPERETRLACSTCGRPICVECSRDAAVGQKCPDCAAPEGRHRVVTAAQLRQTRSGSPVAFILIAVNVVLFFVGELEPDIGRRLFLDFSHFPPAVAQGEWWRGLTAVFLHANITHLLFNMWALFLFGPALERRFGSASFASLYLAAGLGGSALYQAISRTGAAVGASGAIFGLMGALLAATYRQRHTPAGNAVFSQLLVLLAINLALPFVVSNIAWEAHLGGLVAGVIVASAWDRLPIAGRGAAGRRVAVALALAVVALAVVVVA